MVVNRNDESHYKASLADLPSRSKVPLALDLVNDNKQCAS